MYVYLVGQLNLSQSVDLKACIEVESDHTKLVLNSRSNSMGNSPLMSDEEDGTALLLFSLLT